MWLAESHQLVISAKLKKMAGWRLATSIGSKVINMQKTAAGSRRRKIKRIAKLAASAMAVTCGVMAKAYGWHQQWLAAISISVMKYQLTAMWQLAMAGVMRKLSISVAAAESYRQMKSARNGVMAALMKASGNESSENSGKQRKARRNGNGRNEHASKANGWPGEKARK